MKCINCGKYPFCNKIENSQQEACNKFIKRKIIITTKSSFIQSVCDSLSNFVSWLTGLSPTAKKIGLVVIAIVAAIGPLIIFIEKLIGTIMTINKGG